MTDPGDLEPDYITLPAGAFTWWRDPVTDAYVLCGPLPEE